MKIKKATVVLWKRIGIGLVLLSIFGGVIYLYYRTPLFTITSYELVGVPDLYKDAVMRNLTSIATEHSNPIIPRDKMLSYHSRAIKQSIVSVLPNTRTIHIRPISFHKLRITVEHYEPRFKIDSTRGVTKDGIIYVEFKDMSALPTISFASSTMEEVVRDDSRYYVIQGIDTTALNNLSRLLEKIDSVIFPVAKIVVDGYGDVTLYDKRELSRIIFREETNPDKVWSNIVSAIDTEPLKSRLEKENDDLEYLDARFGNKVFYKFTKNLKTAIIEDHATTTQEFVPAQ
jgi:hypothetical protein